MSLATLQDGMYANERYARMIRQRHEAAAQEFVNQPYEVDAKRIKRILNEIGGYILTPMAGDIGGWRTGKHGRRDIDVTAMEVAAMLNNGMLTATVGGMGTGHYTVAKQ